MMVYSHTATQERLIRDTAKRAARMNATSLEKSQAQMEVLGLTNKIAVSIWKDGSWKVWGGMDAYYAQNDPDYLLTIGMGDMADSVCEARL